MKRGKAKLLAALAVLVIAGVYYYVTLPAINIHSSGMWMFILAVLALALIFSIGWKIRIQNMEDLRNLKREITGRKAPKVILALIGVTVVVYLVGSVLSSPIVNADKYQKLLVPETGDFAEDIDQVNYNQIPLLDKDSAELLGNRKMGSMVDMVSQFEVSTLYSQINYHGRPVRVTPLVYASPIKWFTNQKNGIPAYISIDMATQNTELVKVPEGIKYSESEYLNRNIYRHLRFRYPTYIFDQLSFEIDEEGTPYWICPVKKFSIGLFGGQTIGKVVLCNAVTGKCESMDVEDCPTWVDRVYPADLLIQLYDYHGTLKNGFINSILGQKGCLQTTDGFNYLAQDDDVWVYTGVTSVSGDRSNVGFVLMNQRTRETKYYEVAGAEEYSAMASAEGQVQNLGYRASFPLLLNISDEPTYFIALKDNAGLVKKYAMVNIRRYQNVAIGDTVAECEQTYVKMLRAEGGGTTVSDDTAEKITGRIKRIAQGVVDGNTHFYVTLENSDAIFDVSLVEFMEIIRYDVGDAVTLTYLIEEPVCTVLGLEAAASEKTEMEETSPEDAAPEKTETEEPSPKGAAPERTETEELSPGDAASEGERALPEDLFGEPGMEEKL
ncbi:MAG: CvpA family protein [Lachnospiraceae bacterium]|nr:CvpA family protein [Lachnospiraceae bacterium]